MPSLEQLEVFVAAAERGSFSAAARHLGKSQSTVSLSIANLEVDLDLKVFDRTTRSPKLTEVGERLLRHAHAVLQQMRHLTDASISLAEGAEPYLTISIDDAIHLPSVDGALKEFAQQFPATEIELLSLPSSEIPEAIRSKRADIGLMFSTHQVLLGVEQSFIGNLPFVAVSHPDHALASVEKITANNLLGHLQIMHKPADHAEHTQFPVLSPRVWKTTSFSAIRQQVLSGIGWAYLPEHLVINDLGAARLVRLNFRFEHNDWSPAVECVVQKRSRPGLGLAWLQSSLCDILL